MNELTDALVAEHGIVTLQHGLGRVHLLGVVHNSVRSGAKVTRALEVLRPEVVCVELCAEHNVSSREFWQSLSVSDLLQPGKTGLWLASLVGYVGHQRWRLASRTEGLGASAMDATNAALAASPQARVVLVDRHSLITFARAWVRAKPRSRLALLSWMPEIFSDEGADWARYDDPDKDRESLESTVAEAALMLGGIQQVVIEERAAHISNQLHKTQGDVLAVVSLALVAPIAQRFEAAADIAPLADVALPAEIAPIGRTWRVIRWGMALLAWWLLIDGDLHASLSRLSVFATICGAVASTAVLALGGHVVTALTAGVGFPLTALLPIQPFGLWAGRVEAHLRPKTPADAEQVWGGCRRRELRANRIVRPLLIAWLLDAGAPGVLFSLAMLRAFVFVVLGD